MTGRMGRGRWRRIREHRWAVGARRRSRPAVLALLLTASLLAGIPAAPAAAQGGDTFAFSAGSFDVLNGTRSGELGFEYRFEPRAFELVPTVGVAVHGDEGGYVLAGLRKEFRASERWLVTPHFGLTLYDEGDGKDLGHAVEFRSGLELSYRLNDRSRLGVSFYHLSNAGLDETNPGSESLVLVYSFD